MVRDFMGLANLMKEAPEEPVDAASGRSLAMQWLFSNKNPNTSPRIMSFQENNPPKTGFDSLASTGLVSIRTSETFEAHRKPYPNNNVQGVEKNTGVSYTVHQPPIASRVNISVSPSSTCIAKNPFAKNLIDSMNAKTLAGNSISRSNKPVVGTTDLRNSTKISTAPAQLTIFYNGSVCVYDNISHEKAQAIMLLAGNGPQKPVINNTVQAKPSEIEGFVLSRPHGVNTTSHRQSPSSHLTSISNNDATAVKPGGVLVHSQKAKSLGSAPLFSSPDDVPQFRRKSLARFLEKRKERVIYSAPYATKQSAADS